MVSGAGKEAKIMLLVAGDFVGEESVAAVAGLYMATAVAIAGCTALRSKGRRCLGSYTKNTP